MEDRKMEVINQLMEELQDLMQPSGDELGERLGRPKVEAMEMDSGDMPMDGEEGAMDGDFEDPEEKLKARLLKLRG